MLNTTILGGSPRLGAAQPWRRSPSDSATFFEFNTGHSLYPGEIGAKFKARIRKLFLKPCDQRFRLQISNLN
jgi:hypothetical protein